MDMLLLLQRRGRLTAGQLATALEVSERTILRDVEALSEAGVPLVTHRGSNGGIDLLDGFETRLTGLTPQEAQALFLVGQPQVAHRLGLGAATRSAGLKLGNALPRQLAEQAESLHDWFVHDPDAWGGHRIPHGELRRIASAIDSRRRVEIHLADRPPLTVEPLGLVLKAGAWHLVVVGDPADVIRLDDLVATRLTTQAFETPPGFALTEFWAGYVARRHAAS